MGRVWCHFNLVLCCKTQWLAGQQGRSSGKFVRQHQLVCFYLTHVSLYLASPLPSSNHPHTLFWACSLSLSVFPHCCEVMSPWREDKNTLWCTCCSNCRSTWGGMCANLNGDGLAAAYLSLSNYKMASREGENTSTIPSRCLISHSFSYWTFLFKEPF